MIVMSDFLTMDGVKFEGKVALVRVDLNLGIERGKLDISDRVKEHAKTIRELSEKKARVVILAHQGRAGDKDFLSLENHAAILSRYVKKPVKFADDIVGATAKNAIEKLRNGQILLLENVRFLAEESLELPADAHSKSIFVQRLSKLADIFVLDAFSCSHRSHASIVGFTKTLKTVAGRVMEKELSGLNRFDNPAKPCVYVLGGAKVEECVKLLKSPLAGKVDKILTSGILGELCLIAKGVDIGKKKELLEKDGKLKLLPDVKQFLEKNENIEMPVDFAYDDNGRKEISVSGVKNTDKPCFDIGSITIDKYKNIISEAKTVYIKGPLGVYEDKSFQAGTKEVFSAAANSGAFILIGGGNTLSAVDKFKVNRKNMHISLAGGALLSYLSGEKLPGVEALKNSGKK